MIAETRNPIGWLAQNCHSHCQNMKNVNTFLFAKAEHLIELARFPFRKNMGHGLLVLGQYIPLSRRFILLVIPKAQLAWYSLFSVMKSPRTKVVSFYPQVWSLTTLWLETQCMLHGSWSWFGKIQPHSSSSWPLYFWDKHHVLAGRFPIRIH